MAAAHRPDQFSVLSVSGGLLERSLPCARLSLISPWKRWARSLPDTLGAAGTCNECSLTNFLSSKKTVTRPISQFCKLYLWAKRYSLISIITSPTIFHNSPSSFDNQPISPGLREATSSSYCRQEMESIEWAWSRWPAKDSRSSLSQMREDHWLPAGNSNFCFGVHQVYVDTIRRSFITFLWQPSSLSLFFFSCNWDFSPLRDLLVLSSTVNQTWYVVFQVKVCVSERKITCLA